MAKIIDGKAISAVIREEIKRDVEKLLSSGKRAPGLAVVLVGNLQASETYVRLKKKAAAEVGIISIDRELPDTITQDELLKVVQDLNADPTVDGILVQLPLPPHINSEEILAAISLEKDADGFHPLNIGRLAMRGRKPLAISCTPLGCIELLERSGVEIAGKNAVVLGRSNIVGTPVSLLLIQKDATVTVCHSKSVDLPNIIRQADILIAAAGRAQMVRGDWIKPGAVVIDVGTNSVDNGKGGKKLVGDVNFEEAVKVAGAITPVPGGVGPMTITMLLRNTLQSCQRHFGLIKKI
eukprot:TRINITY_DN3269_c0_g1_i3.p1 TRINITY_DN3269_c0_g1~~TRINITY_DN3269_c0_g1_i3.p1  ORF type:complete len:295 (-),score=51.16 TRINITY_DN3269_c0_g1_i3:22-906(-)